MTFRGHVENGKVILEDGSRLADGTRVEVRPVETEHAKGVGKPGPGGLTVNRRLLKYAGKGTDLPPDATRNLDHYLYGHPRR